MTDKDHKDSYLDGIVCADELFARFKADPDSCENCLAQGLIVGLTSQLLKNLGFMDEAQQDDYFLTLMNLGRAKAAAEEVPASRLN